MKPDPMYRDDGEFKTWRDGKNTREYDLWQHIRTRCYDESQRWKYPWYVDCTVDKRFHSYQNFAAWATKQVGFAEGFQLDKDLLVRGNRIYSPDCCVFLPTSINSLLNRNSKIRGDMPIGVRQKDKSREVYTAQMSQGQKKVYIGTFSCPSEAFHAYKIAKEQFMKEMAEKYKAVIDPRAYAALMAYQVEITD